MRKNRRKVAKERESLHFKRRNFCYSRFSKAFPMKPLLGHSSGATLNWRKSGRIDPACQSATTNHDVAVLMAVYNGARFLGQQVESIIQQSYAQHLHIYVRDDGSTDGSAQLLLDIQSRFPGKITIVEDEDCNLGIIGNFQRLMECASESEADYFMFADQDDFWFPDKVAVTLAKMQQTEQQSGAITPTLIHTDLCVAGANLEIIDASFWHYEHLHPARSAIQQLCMQNTVTGCTVMINRPLLEKSLPMPLDVITHDWWLALIASTSGVVRFVPRATMLYRQHGNNDTGAKHFDFAYMIQSIRRFAKQQLFWTTLKRHQDQTSALIKRCGDDLSTTDFARLRNFVSLTKNCSTNVRVTTIFRLGFTRHGIIRNIVLFIKLVF